MASPHFLLSFFFFFFYLSSLSCALLDAEAASIVRRQLLHLKINHGGLEINHSGDLLLGRHHIPHIPHCGDKKQTSQKNFPNERLERAYIALQAWKKAIQSDPLNMTGNWVGEDVCAYNGVYCSPALDDPKLNVVAGIDLNHGNIGGFFPLELGLLTDLAVFHLNSNAFSGVIPKTFENLTQMYEFDVSNNKLIGGFPYVVLKWPNLKYLDLRFNNFIGPLPKELFEKDCDALILNDNQFTGSIPETVGKSKASVITLANNKLIGKIPKSMGSMTNLNEVIMSGNYLGGCLPQEIGSLKNMTVLDVSNNGFSGNLPNFSCLENVEIINVAHNELNGNVFCGLPQLKNFNVSHNFFTREDPSCMHPAKCNAVFDDLGNCVQGRPSQKTSQECLLQGTLHVDCSKI